MARFFIERPIFATVIALLFIVAGGICMFVLPVAQYPEITPPQVQVTANYVGASSEVVADTVATPLEQQINGTPGMIYMSSTSANNGQATIVVTFDIGYDTSIGAVDILSRTNIATPQLPEVVRKTGIQIVKQSPDIMQVVCLTSPNETYDSIFLSNYASIHIADELKRLPGMGQVTLFGERKYSMRVWLDPDKMSALNMTPSNVIDAIQDQNKDIATGKLGGLPISEEQRFEYHIHATGRLKTVEEFENIIVRTEPNGQVVRIKDLGNVELGAENYSTVATLDGKQTIAMGIYQLPGANALDLADRVHETMERLSKHFPPDVEYSIPYNTTRFVKASISEVVETLLEAMVIVFLVVYVFLQSFRTTIIPAVTIPVSLIGTFGLMMLLGFSINTLTMLGLVLAIGLVVDDAIVVVENVQRQLEEDESISPFKAAIFAMREVTSPIIATSLVLMAVFIPVAFMPGISGRLYNQFALTIACSVGISTINSLTLSPALCALFLRPGKQKHGWFFSKFNQGFNWVNDHYRRSLKKAVPRWKTVTLFMLGVVGLTYLLLKIVPGSFLPEEDQGYFMALVNRPEATSLIQTADSVEKAAGIIRSLPGVKSTVAMTGLNIATSGIQSNVGTIFCILNDWDERKTPDTKIRSIIQETLVRTNQEIPKALVIPFNAPAIPGISSTGGFEFEIQDVNSLGYNELARVTREFVEKANQRPELEQISSPFNDSTPGYFVDLDRDKAKMMGVTITDVFRALQVYLGSYYINDFNIYGRVFRVYVQAKESYRQDERDISDLYVRNNKGEMIPLSALAKIEPHVGPEFVSHYNIYASALINGRPAAGYSSSQAVKAMEEVAAEVLPEGMEYKWTGIIYQQQKAGILAPLIFALALVFVYLFLCAQYESWTMPTMVMLAVPLAIFGALAAQWIRGNYNDVYCQIGMVMLVGLASKNAILIVEFAANLRREGRSIIDAALEAAHLRLRPILMTAFAFILGVVPLVIASGAGAAARNSLGTTVFGGMLVSTILSLMVVPTLFVAIERLREKCGVGKPKPERSEETPEAIPETREK